MRATIIGGKPQTKVSMLYDPADDEHPERVVVELNMGDKVTVDSLTPYYSNFHGPYFKCKTEYDEEGYIIGTALHFERNE